MIPRLKGCDALCDDEFKCLDLIICLFLIYLQEVHELLGNYDLKYCFVDKYKGTGWSTTPWC